MTTTRFKRATARRLRQNSTDSEAMLWRHLQRFEARGSHFRRQAPIGNFVVDFACLAARLVIEVDGSQHAEGDGPARDQKRTQWLEGEGYRVIRFWNNDISRNIKGVLDVIQEALYGSSQAEPRVLKHARRRRLEDAG